MTSTPSDGPGGQPEADPAVATTLSPGSAHAEDIARKALRWDAAYCAVAGIAIAAFTTSIAEQVEVSAWIVACTGVGAVVWAGFLALLARHEQWRRSTAIAVVANASAAVAIGYWAVARGDASGVILGLLALQVAAFGVAQAWALVDR